MVPHHCSHTFLVIYRNSPYFSPYSCSNCSHRQQVAVMSAVAKKKAKKDQAKAEEKAEAEPKKRGR